MPPGGPGKRKRDESQINPRPSPHRPNDMGLARHQSEDSPRTSQGNRSNGGGGGNRRGSRQQRGNRDNRNDSNQNSPAASRRQSVDRQVPHSKIDVSSPAPPRLAPQVQASGQSQAVPAPTPRSQQLEPESVIPAEPTSPLEAPKSYYYEILTKERLDGWEEAGKQQVLDLALQALQGNDWDALGLVYLELIQAGLYTKIGPRAAGKLVKDIISNQPSETILEPDTIFLDIFDTATEAFDWRSSSTDSKPEQSKNEILHLQNILSFTEISLKVVREVLDGQLLEALGLVRAKVFGRTFIRKQTDAIYKTTNFNLLREETEGYAKLIIELATTLDASNPTKNTWSYKLVKPLLDNVQALVGAFHLDAARTLDIILDLAAANLISYCKFIARLMRISPYWPAERDYEIQELDHPGLGGLPRWALPGHEGWELSQDEELEMAQWRSDRDVSFWNRLREIGIDAFFELGQRRILSEPEVLEQLSAEQANDARFTESRRWIEVTKTLPPSGNDVAAQLLGQKLRFYTTVLADNKDEEALNRLVFLAGLLIKIGFISLRDLYAHMYPTDELMDAAREKQEAVKAKEEAQRNGGSLNALASAAALTDDTLAGAAVPPARSRLEDSRAATPARSEQGANVASKSDVPSSEPPRTTELKDQKIQLLRQLLLLGCLPEAMYLLGRFPWMLQLYSDIPELINRIIHQSISKLYEPLNVLQNRHSLAEQARYSVTDNSSAAKGSLKLIPEEPRRKLRWPKIERSVEQGDYRFYWDDWTDNIPLCRSVDDFFAFCNTFVNLVGVKIGEDATLLSKFARIGKDSLTKDFSEANQTRWIDLCKRLLCPALSMTKAETPVVEEVWSILRLFSTKIRYSIYTEWCSGPTSRIPEVLAATKATEKEAKKVLKTMSADKDSAKSVARQLAKVASANPGKVFENSIRQLESYPNMITVFVEGGRYFTRLGYDVLTWTLLSSLASNRARIASTGLTISPWLQYLSEFSGQLYRRYSQMNPLPILQYVLMQIRQGVCPNLRVLKEMVQEMAGIAMGFEFNDKQLAALGGGPELRKYVHLDVKDRRYESKITAKRLMRILVDNDLAGPFIVAIAQARQSCIHAADQDSLKLISENFDDIHQNLMQYHDLCLSNLAMDEFANIIPSIASMVGTHGIEPGIAFTIHRSSIAHTLSQQSGAQQANGVQQMSTTTAVEQKLKVDGDTEMQDVVAAIEDETATDSQTVAVDVEQHHTEENNAHADIPWIPYLQNLGDELQTMMPSEFSKQMSMMFYVSFWSLSLYDIAIPTEQYLDQCKRIGDKADTLKRDKKDVSTSGQRKKEQELKELSASIQAVKDEQNDHLRHWTAIRRRLNRERNTWFEGFNDKEDTLYEGLLQECFLPRLAISPLEAVFCAKMLFLPHSLKAPAFKLSDFLDKMFEQKTLANLIFQFTGREAENFGRFLADVLSTLLNWHGTKSKFEQGALGKQRDLLGFATEIKDGKPTKMLEFDDYRARLFSWHNNIFHAFKVCIKPGGEYMHIHNALKILKSISTSFPKVIFHGKGITDLLTEVAKEEAPPDRQNGKREGEGRQDLSVLTNSVLAAIKPNHASWILPQAFRQHNYVHKEVKAEAPSQTASKPTRPTVQANEKRAETMNAKAEDFKPRVNTSVNGVSAAPISAREDGELTATPKTEGQPSLRLDNSNIQHQVPESKHVAARTENTADRVRSSAPPPRPRKDDETGRANPEVAARQPPPMTARPEPTRTHSQQPQPPLRRSELQDAREPPDNRYRDERRNDRLSDSRSLQPPLRGSDVRSERPPERLREMPRDRGHASFADDRSRDMALDTRHSSYREPPNDRPPRAPLPPQHSDFLDGHTSRPVSQASVESPRGPAASGMHPSREPLVNGRDPRGSVTTVDNRSNRPDNRGPYSNQDGYPRENRPRPQSPRRDQRSDFGGPPAEQRGQLSSGRLTPSDSGRRGYAAESAPNGPRASLQQGGRQSGGSWPQGETAQNNYRGTERGFDYPRQPMRHQDENYGRLNQDPEPSPPGPRGPRSTPAAPSMAPTGPTSDRRHGQSGGSATPSASAATSDANGIHPSRLQKFHPDDGAQMPPRGPSQLSAGRPVNTSSTNGPRGPPTALPSGPRGHHSGDVPSQLGSPIARGPPASQSMMDRRMDSRDYNRGQDSPSQASPQQQDYRHNTGPPRGAPTVPLEQNIRGRAALGAPSGPASNGPRGPPENDMRAPRYDGRGPNDRNSGAYNDTRGPSLRPAREPLPPQEYQARAVVGGRQNDYGREAAQYSRGGPPPPGPPPGPGRRESSGYGQMSDLNGPRGDGRRDMSGTGRKREFNGEGPQMDEKRPRRGQPPGR